MISRSFLRHSIAGVEFLDFQNDTFFKELTSVIKTHLKDGFLKNSVIKDLTDVIEKFTGFNNIIIKLGAYQNYAIDSGYFSPNNVVNNKGIDDLLDVNDTTLYRWFSNNKDKVFKGSIDYSTGKVHGSFKSVPASLYLETDVTTFFPFKKVEKYGATIEEVLAGVIVHELGHMFGGCMMMLTAVKDNMLLKAGLRSYKKAVTKEDRVIVLRDSKVLLGIESNDKTLNDLAENPNEEIYILCFNKMITQRNRERSLSMGVPVMTSEVIADMYSVRMGCGKGILAAVGVFSQGNDVKSAFSCFFLGAFLSSNLGISLFAINPVVYLSFVGAVSVMAGLLGYFSYITPGIYNSDPRRFDDIIRQMIDKLKTVKNLPSKELNEALEYLTKMLELNKKLIPWHDNTVVGRFMGRVLAGSDFKKLEVEHFTSVLLNHEVNLLGHQLKEVTV